MASSSLEPPPELLEAQPEQELVSISPEITAVAAPLPSRDELYAMGKTLRSKFPRKAHAEWKPAADRLDPVELVLRAEADDCRSCSPYVMGRMMRSAFTFYRGASLAMACDLASTPSPGFASSAVEIRSSGGPHLSGDWLELVHWRILVPEGYRPARCGDSGATSAARPHGVFV